MKHSVLRLLDPNLKQTQPALAPVLKSRNRVNQFSSTARLPPKAIPTLKRSSSKITFRVRKLKGNKHSKTVSNAENVQQEVKQTVQEQLNTTDTNMMQTPETSPRVRCTENGRYNKLADSQNLLSPLKCSCDFISID